jgi:hypothetical protein
MADQLYLSLWFPNFRLQGLPAALTSVLRQFAVVAKDRRVAAASAYPIDFTESPTYQRLYVLDPRAADTPDTAAALIDSAVAEATEQLHDDMAYEFEMKWNLWTPALSADPAAARDEEEEEDPEDLEHLPSQDDPADDLEDSFDDFAPRKPGQPVPFPRNVADGSDAESAWKLQPSTVRIIGFGPEFDQAGYAQNGHIRVDFGLDTPWTLEQTHDDVTLDQEGAKHIQQNVEMLLAFTLLVEKHCGISSRLLWTESGEPLAEKLIGRLQRVN